MPVYQRGNLVYLVAADGRQYRYDILQNPIGSGAMGTVFHGALLQPPFTHVAIKKVNDRFSNVPSIRQRAQQEAELQFRHPNLVEMIGYCEQRPNIGSIYIISKFVCGMSISAFIDYYKIREKENWVNRICDLIFPVMDGMEFLHQQNVVHLDIKPSNIMVENGTNVRLMDLGIAYANVVFDISAAGLVGTPGYAAPEQYITPGTAIKVDCRTDIYELGVTIYELLSGIKPDTESIAPIANVQSKVIDVLTKAMQPDMNNRYENIKEFREALQSALTKRRKWWWQH